MKKEIPCRVQTARQGIFIGKRNPENNWRERKGKENHTAGGMFHVKNCRKIPAKSEKIIGPDFRKYAFAKSFHLRNLRIPAHAEFRMQEKQGPECTAAGQISGISSPAAGKAVCSEKKRNPV